MYIIMAIFGYSEEKMAIKAERHSTSADSMVWEFVLRIVPARGVLPLSYRESLWGMAFMVGGREDGR